MVMKSNILKVVLFSLVFHNNNNFSCTAQLNERGLIQKTYFNLTIISLSISSLIAFGNYTYLCVCI